MKTVIKMLFKKFVSLSVFLLLVFLSQSQDAAIDSIKAQLARHTANNLTEKIYLHTDRNFYIPGEMIWFKAYMVNGSSGHISDFSKVAYVDVLDENNKPQLQAKILLQQGTGNGSLYLPLTLNTGAYKIRAYTSWMKNFDASFYYEKNIQVVNTFMSAGIPVTDTTEKIDIQFFPEGGNLLNGFESRVAYKITANNGKGVNDFSAIVVNQHNDTISSFGSYKFGIGSLILKPQPNHQYKSIVTTASGKTYEQALPLANETGYTMRASVAANKVFVEVNAKVPSNANNTVYLLAQTRGILKTAEAKTLENGKTVFVIPEALLDAGISQLTVFSSNRQAVCERLYFKNPTNNLQIEASTSNASYQTRKKIDIDITAATTLQKSLAHSMSMSVYRLDDLQKETAFDIRSYLWLSSDLKGNVENPNWYFNNSDSAATGLDYLMLTHGWRRFYWYDVQQGNTPPLTFLPEIDGHIIYGRLLDSSTQKPHPAAPVYLSIPGIHTKFYATQSDQNGLFKFYTRDVLGQGEIMLQADGLEGRPYNIEVHTPFSEKYAATKIVSDVINESLKSSLEKASLNAQVQRKYAWELMKKFRLPSDVDTSSFYGKPDERYRLDDYTRFTTMEEVLREYVLGVLVGRSGGKFKLTMLDVPNNRLFRDNPLVLLDGVPVLDMDRILSYDPLKVNRIELVKRRYYYGPLMFDGIVNMITYKGSLDSYSIDPKTIILDYDGLQMQREFYSPVYQTEDQVNNHIADYRNLLYWSPDVRTDTKGKAQVSFYSSDVKGRYKAVIEGISNDGAAGSRSLFFDVK